MTYSRASPSPRYLELQRLYRIMHKEGERFQGRPPQETFPGMSLPAQAPRIKALIGQTGAQTILDYGSGKGMQYEPRPVRDPSGAQWPGIIDYWDVDEVVCYDPAYAPFSKLPEGRFDGVVCTDVLEHCPEEDIPWIVDEIFAYANLFVFANVACYPARKRLPTGENAHCTIRPPQWWRTLLETVAERYSGILYEIWMESYLDTPQGPKRVEERIGRR